MVGVEALKCLLVPWGGVSVDEWRIGRACSRAEEPHRSEGAPVGRGCVQSSFPGWTEMRPKVTRGGTGGCGNSHLAERETC